MANPSIISLTKNSFSALSETPSPPCHSFTNISAVSNHYAGHQNLWNAGIIHRDDNILIGNPDVAEGNRGLIIDLDMAILVNREGGLASVDFRMASQFHHLIFAL